MKANPLLDPEARQRAAEARKANHEKTEAAREARKPKNRGYGELLQHLQKVISRTRFLSRVKRFEEGSIKAAVELHCLTCCADDIGAIRDCSSQKTCPLHPFRPYQAS